MILSTRTAKWRFGLTALALITIAATSYYIIYLANRIEEYEKFRINLMEKAYTLLSSEEQLNNDCDFTLEFEITQGNYSVPIIWVDQRGTIRAGKNFGEEEDMDMEFLEKELEKIRKSGREPLVIESSVGDEYIYYKESGILNMLQFFPIVIFILITLFIGLGYIGFNTARKSEENRIWAGMAKEAAHQLGTPISGLIAWVEHLKMAHPDHEETHEIIDEIGKDVQRLEKVADRFSKIGSEPELHMAKITPELKKIFQYMKRRAPRRVNFDYIQEEDRPYKAAFNAPLFEWVIENLLRNALDSMEGKGAVVMEVSDDPNWLYIDISDTGKGIPENKFKSIFRPGYTTKKRGWGLGLSLAKRIVENYHSGKIFVKESKVGVGTTFRIQLPLKGK